MGNQLVEQAIVVEASDREPNMGAKRIALFTEAGDPVDLGGGGGGGGPVTGDDVLLTGYDVGEAETVEATDTANEAFGKLMAGVIALATAPAPSGADIVLDGYEIGSSDPVLDGDSAMAAIAKLEARVLELESTA